MTGFKYTKEQEGREQEGGGGREGGGGGDLPHSVIFEEKCDRRFMELDTFGFYSSSVFLIEVLRYGDRSQYDARKGKERYKKREEPSDQISTKILLFPHTL